MLLKTLYIPLGTDCSRAEMVERPYWERDEQRERSSLPAASRLVLVGRENCGDLGGFGSMGRLR